MPTAPVIIVPRVPRSAHGLGRLIVLLVLGILATACAEVQDLTTSTPTSPATASPDRRQALAPSPAAALRRRADAPPSGSRPERVSPLRDPRGLHPGLTRIPAAERSMARALIRKVAATAPGAAGGYDRDEQFGPAWTDAVDITWGRNGCRTREEILRRDMKGIDFRAGTDDCVVLIGILQEPYTGRTVQFSKSRPTQVQVDHVMPLAYDWRQGARRWTQAKREQIANDPLNLLAVDGPANQRKSDSGPAEWMPPNPEVRCAYSVRFAMVSRKYALPVTFADRDAMLKACGS